MVELAGAMSNSSFQSLIASQVLQSFGALGRVGIRRPSLDGFRGLTEPGPAAANVKNLPAEILKSLVYLQFLRAHATELERKNNFAAALRVLQEAAGLAEETGVVELEIVVLAQVGNLTRRSGDLNTAEGYLRRAERLGEETGVTPVASWVHYEIGYIFFMRGVFKDACESFQKSYDAAKEENNDLVGLVAALGVLGRQHVLMGDVDKGVELNVSAEELIDSQTAQLDADWVARWKRNVVHHRAESELERGNIEAAAEFSLRAEETPTEKGRPEKQNPYSLLRQSRIELLRGNLEEAEILAAAAVRRLSGSGRQELEPADRLRMAEGGSEFLAHYGTVLLQLGHPDATSKLDTAIEYPIEYANSRGHAWAHLALARHFQSAGAVDQARVHAKAAIRVTEQHYRTVSEEATQFFKALTT